MSKLLCLVLGLAFVLVHAQDINRQPNIVLIMVDDLGAECINSYGGTSYNTPRLSQMAKSGMQFENCHAQPICTPSRVKLMTGRSNKKNHVKFGYLDPEERTFSQELKAAGYTTLVAGKWQLGSDNKLPKHFGFDEYLLWQLSTNGKDERKRDKRYVNPFLEKNGELYDKAEGRFSTDMMVDYISDFMERKKEQPFLVYYPMNLTHCPFVPTPHSEDWNPSDLGSKTYKGNQKYFADMVAYMDFSIGRIVDKIEQLGLSEDTILIFTADNGTDQPIVSMMGDVAVEGGKGKTTDNGTHVPLIVNWKGTVKAGFSNTALVDFSDFFPTLCEAADIKIDANLDLDGISFYPQLLGKDSLKRKWIHTWYNREGGSSPLAATTEWVRDENYKFYVGNRFYNVKKDPKEKNELEWNQMTDKEKEIRQAFIDVLMSYNYLRN